MWETILATVIVAVITAVMGVIGKAVNDWSARQKQLAEDGHQRQEQDRLHNVKIEAIDAIEIGVAKAQQEIVDSARAAVADGKLTKDELRDELKKAEAIARKTALEIATGPAADYLEKLTADAIGGLIDLVLGRNKE